MPFAQLQPAVSPNAVVVNGTSPVAIQQAVTAAGSGGTIVFPPGTYNFTSVGIPTVPYSYQRWIGTPGATIFQWDASVFPNLIMHQDGVSIFRTLTNVQFWGIVFQNTHAGVVAFGLNIGASDHIPTRIYFDNCEFDHCSGNITGGSYHGIGTMGEVYVHDTFSDRAIGCTTSIPGTNFDNTGSEICHVLIINQSNMGIYAGGVLDAEIHDFRILGPSASTAAFAIDNNAARDTRVYDGVINAPNGVLFEQGSGTGGRVAIRNVTVIGVGTNTGVGLQIWPNAGAGAYASFDIGDCIIALIKFGVNIIQEPVGHIHGNTYDQIGQSPIVLQRTSGNFTEIVIEDETSFSYGQVAANQAAVLITPAASGVFIHECHWNAGGATTPQGVNGLNSPGEIIGNTFLGIAAANCYTSIGASVKIASNSTGTLPAVASIAVTASVFTYTNTDIYDEQVTVQGGTVTVIAVRGVTITNATSGQFYLHPNDTIAVTYSVAPAMFKIPV